MTDQELLHLCQKGEGYYFGEIYERYIDQIYGFVFLKTRDKQQAEDIVSDIFFSAYSKISGVSLESVTTLKAWLFTIARNKVIDFYRTNKQTEEITENLDVGVYEDIGQTIDNKELLLKITEFLDTCKPEHKEVFVYRIWYDLSYKEIAQITGTSFANAKKIVSRLSKKMAEVCLMLLLFVILL